MSLDRCRTPTALRVVPVGILRRDRSAQFRRQYVTLLPPSRVCVNGSVRTKDVMRAATPRGPKSHCVVKLLRILSLLIWRKLL